MAYQLLGCLCLSLALMSTLPSAMGVSQEGLILLQVKFELTDPNGFFTNWNGSDNSPCGWRGITCDRKSNLVLGIDLSKGGLEGPFPGVVCRLPQLRNLSLAFNNIGGRLPPNFSLCSRLELLDLSQNVFVGDLPSFISELGNLKYLDLSSNNFSGPIPPAFGNLPKLQTLNLCCNFLNETIPSFLTNLSNLVLLSLQINSFTPGPIPTEIGKLSKLETMLLNRCNLNGNIPLSIGNLTGLIYLDLSQNSLIGSIPENITKLKSAVQIELYQNYLIGSIPLNMGVMLSLKKFDASTNKLNGSIPESLASLPLESLNLFQNNLEGSIPETLANSPNLSELKLFKNILSGNLPQNLGSNSALTMLDVAENQLNGTVPPGLCKQGKLKALSLFSNNFVGQLPEDIVTCSSLVRVRIHNNQLTGDLSGSFWGLPYVSLLEISNNKFHGTISPEIGKAKNLSQLKISGNQFSGTLPSEIGMATNITLIDGSNNRFEGSLPPNLSSLSQLSKLDLQWNQLVGDINISNIASWSQLSELNLSHNRLSGSIPAELGELPVLTYLDLSDNRLIESIPVELGNLHLNIFNVSNNQLKGSVPSAFRGSLYQSSLMGNPGLCGDGFPGLKSCSDFSYDGKEGSQKSWTWLLVVLFALALVILLIGLAWFFRKYNLYSGTEYKNTVQDNSSAWMLTSFHKLGFRGYEILECIDEENVIGSGGSGKVYKATLGSGDIVAIKRLWNTDMTEESRNDHGFKAEVETLGQIRHRNIVKLWCCFANGNSHLLVYEYMPNGSLGDLLHGDEAGLLNWPTRYKIAVGAAQGLAYLHHDCVPPIVHRDVKSNNILLDAEFNARVADFGLAKILQGQERELDSMSVVAGSYGYIAPEYAYTLRVNEKSDIYSFGVVLLELVTGKQPVDPEFEGNKDLVKWVRSKINQENWLQMVLDSRIENCYREEMAFVLKVALICTSVLPNNRPTMRKVLDMLNEAGQHYKHREVGKDAKQSS